MYVHHDRTKLTRVVATNEMAITSAAAAVKGSTMANILAVPTGMVVGNSSGMLTKTTAAVIEEEDEDDEDEDEEEGNVAL